MNSPAFNYLRQHIILLASIISVFLVFFSSCDKSEERIRIGYLPSLAASQMYVGIAEGYFEEAGIETEITEIYSGPELINALQSNSIDIAFGITPPLISARSTGINVKSIIGATYDSKEISEHRLMLPPDSEITKGEDLRGKTIAVVAEGTSDYFGLLQYLSAYNISESEVEIIQTPHPEMIFAISSNSVDAAAGIEPFITTGELSGQTRTFEYYYPEFQTEVGTYLAMNEFIQNNPELVKKFQGVIIKATEFINNNEEEFRGLLPKLENYGVKFKISESVADSVTIMGFKEHITSEGLSRIQEQLLAGGYLTQEIDLSACILPYNE
ncbi:MAG: NrtA/SsuA/CpmA family ABC transporter substrate-binding protein [Balneolaceae bacterium]|nr:NrtA/SsuA/CpmA family ABC transporter substrate-binding protein [Balneolaceae bacterium]MBO6544844.1 NrtA/SsuA/CpmA family ABC transporter substrate-binding protein [Balneolaceae bacterium]MBO6646240.1 NrtA/SsuA/CpmA family ABC transporter substrate-binding protein [Balneolaceae bacterium]